MKEKKQRNFGLIALVFHLIGVVGTLYEPTRGLTVSLTPFNLLLSALLILLTHDRVQYKNLYLLLIVSFVAGYAMEVVGVKTGAIFGNYAYGPTLGLALWDVPLVMGLNWFILTYCFTELAGRVLSHGLLRAALGALGMVLLDHVIEPVAIKLDYWQWESGVIPLQNFVGWFVIALILQWLAQRLLGRWKNDLTIYLIISQIIYFSLILIFY